MARRFIDLDFGALRQSVRTVVRNLEHAQQLHEDAAKESVVQFAEHLIGEAGQRAPLGDGGLRESATTQGPEIVAEGFVVWAAFNIVYARIRDVGGTIVPVKAKALFIPLRKGVRPGQPGLEWGKDFVLAKKAVQKGNRYWSATLDENVPRAAELIGKRVAMIVQQRGGSQ
jgi:hypothetical protein